MTNYDILKEYEAHQTSVPSYKEWLEKTKSLKVLAEAYCKEKQKNDEIKELLKEVLRHELSLKEVSELSRKISEALK